MQKNFVSRGKFASAWYLVLLTRPSIRISSCTVSRTRIDLGQWSYTTDSRSATKGRLMLDIILPVILGAIFCGLTLFLLCTGGCKAVELLRRSPLPDLVATHQGPPRSCCSCSCRRTQYPPAKLCEPGDLNPAQTYLPKSLAR